MATTEDGGKQKILTEVPESLKRLVIIIVKTFYGLEPYIVVDYIQRHVIIKEEKLRDLVKIDLKMLRTFITTLKVCFPQLGIQDVPKDRTFAFFQKIFFTNRMKIPLIGDF